MTGSNYLSKALALYDSLLRHSPEFTLYFFAFDKKTENALNKMQLEKIVIIPLEKLEDAELLSIKNTRTTAEYFFTCTPSIIWYILTNYNVDNCIYLDADIYFFASPQILLNELGENSVMLTEHRYSSELYKEEVSGKYCVQFIPVRNDETGRKIINWWRERCIEWCYYRKEGSLYADQGYLEDWTTRFEGVCVLNHLGGGLAPWNIKDYDIFMKFNKLKGKKRDKYEEFDVIFYHYQDLRFYDDETIRLKYHSNFTKAVKANIYFPYIRKLIEIKKNIHKYDNSFDPHGTIIKERSPFNIIKEIYWKLHPKRLGYLKINKFDKNGASN
jgi:hypothetical protein